MIIAGAASTGGSCISPQPTSSPSSATASGSSGSSGGGVDPIRAWMGFYHGYVAQAQQEGKGLVDLGKTLGCGAAHLCSNNAYQQEHAKADRLLSNPDRLSVPQQLSMLWQGATAPIREDWKSGHKAQAAGRALWIGLSTVAATKGLAKAGGATGDGDSEGRYRGYHRHLPKADASGTFRFGIRIAPGADSTWDLVTLLVQGVARGIPTTPSTAPVWPISRRLNRRLRRCTEKAILTSCALAAASILPVGKGGKALEEGVEALCGIKAASELTRASEAALRAADNAGVFIVKMKHLAGSPGRYNKFIRDVNPNEVIAEALRSPNARFFANPQLPNTFRVVTDLDRVVGTRGETSVRVIVSNGGRILNAFPVKVQ